MARTAAWRQVLVVVAVGLALPLAPVVTGRAFQSSPDHEAHHAETPSADPVCTADAPPAGHDPAGMAGMGDMPSMGMEDMPAMGMEDMHDMGMADDPSGAGMSMMGDVDLMLLDMLIAPGESAIAMAQVALNRDGDDAGLPPLQEEIVRLAEEIVAAQGAEVAQLRAWRQEWYPDAAAMPMGEMMGQMEEMMGQMPAMDGMDMANMMDMMGMMDMAMDPAGGIATLCAAPEPFALAFLDAMIPHHRHAVMLAEGAQRHATQPRLVGLAGTIVAARQRELAEMEGWRVAWYGPPVPAAAAPIRVAITEGEMFVAAGQTTFRVGDSYTFIVTNAGQVEHDLLIAPVGASHDHASGHAAQADRLVAIAPGETRELTWFFPMAGMWELACRIPGHYEAGMRLEVQVTT